VQIRSGVVAVAALALVHGTALAQPKVDFDKVQIKPAKVAGSVYVLYGQGGNIGVSAGPDGILIIDDQFAPLAPKIKAALKGIQDAPLKWILNTHFHFDHTGGNEIFGKEAPIIAHENVRNRLKAGSTTLTVVSPPAAVPTKGRLGACRDRASSGASWRATCSWPAAIFSTGWTRSLGGCSRSFPQAPWEAAERRLPHRAG